MIHEDTPWKLAVIHAGDWLVKLLVVTVKSSSPGARRLVFVRSKSQPESLGTPRIRLPAGAVSR